MRTPSLLLAAITTMMYAVHAMPSSDLAARKGVNDLANERHQFHHFDRNQRTANQARDGIHGSDVQGSGPFVKSVQEERAQHDKGRKTTKEVKVLEKRFMKNPDYSEGGSGGGSNSVNPAANPTATQEPASANSPATTDKGDPRAKLAARV
ncbi:hypothetical protein BS17DRAFT_775034 [Gyrodon lividus]|nr:hypothetical protein BS17DRAFT_775034 [Gyrodon lividus]